MLETNCEYLKNDIMDVVRAFNAEECAVVHYFYFSRGEFHNSVGFEGEIRDFCEAQDVENDLEYRRYAKRFAKLAVYKVLSRKFGELPWGALTGIRPTKLAYAELAAGRDFAPLFDKMGVSAQNTRLIREIISRQTGVLNAGGQSLYISVPFCPTKCDYCSFITAPVSRTRQYIDDYITRLVKELESVRNTSPSPRAVYIGGGTPFVLSEEQLERIYVAVTPFLSPSCEYTVEAGRPDVFTQGKLALSKKYGVGRICVNPQSFLDRTLENIGRKHTAAQTLKAYAMAEKFGFDINLDLIAGLDGESVSDFEYSLEKAAALGPENITVHTLSLKAGAKLKERVDRLEVGGVEKMILSSREILSAAGYFPYYLYRQKYQAGGLENTGWSKAGKECVYNILTMEEAGDNIAVGAGAISKRVFSGGERIERYASPKDIPTYFNKADEIIKRRAELFG